jgi:GTP-binding protein HflX
LLVLKKEDRRYKEEALALLSTLDIYDVKIHFVKKPNHRYYLQEDFVKKISESNSESDNNDKNFDLIIIYDRLKPWQYYNLSRSIKAVEIWDLTSLILKIFELHAGSLEAKLRIELLRIRHQIPFVKEYIRLSKLGEQSGFMGSGAYGYETLLRSLRRREVYIARKLDEIKRKREMLTLNRIKTGYPNIAIIGYTSAGKTTLYNTLTEDTKVTGPKLFKTLSPKSGLVKTPCGEVIVTDTIGFIRKMPDEVIDVFHSVISEIKYSDQIILLTDLSDPLEDYIEKMMTSLEVLKKIDAIEKPIIIVMNKTDLVNEEVMRDYKEITEKICIEEGIIPRDILSISALKRDGIENLLMSLCKNIDHINRPLRGSF